MASIISAGTTSGTALNMAGDTSGVLQLATNGSTTAITIDTSQNVGIGTASPSIGVGFLALKVKGQGVGGVGSSIVESTDGATWLQNYSGASTSDDPAIIYPTGKALRFGTGTQNTSSYTERMRIDSSGNVIVNNTAQLGIGKFGVLFAGSTNNGIEIQDSTTTTGAVFSGFRNSAGTLIGSISRNTTTNAVLYNTSSDYRLKENITPLTNALDKIFALKPCKWTWKDCDGIEGEGFIAHEVQEVIPAAVSGEKDAVDEEGNIKAQGMDASYLVATLTAAIQEQQTIINDLKARITALEGAA